jgi:hypothetical protein
MDPDIILCVIVYPIAAIITARALQDCVEDEWEAQEIFAGSVVWPILLIAAFWKYSLPATCWVFSGFKGLWCRRPYPVRKATNFPTTSISFLGKISRLRRSKKTQVPKAKVIKE